jgi:DNA-damage-inducible protein J
MAQLNIRIDDSLKTKAEKACSDMGLTLSAAINVFLTKVANERRIPFEITADPFYSDEHIAMMEKRICNAKMVRKASGLYFYITCYVSKKEYIPTDKEVGIDFGIEHNLTLSDGNIFDVSVKESKMIKHLSKRSTDHG